MNKENIIRKVIAKLTKRPANTTKTASMGEIGVLTSEFWIKDSSPLNSEEHTTFKVCGTRSPFGYFCFNTQGREVYLYNTQFKNLKLITGFKIVSGKDTPFVSESEGYSKKFNGTPGWGGTLKVTYSIF